MDEDRKRGEDERRKRLASALRENLKRRKAQDRARRDGPQPEPGPGGAAPGKPKDAG